MFNIIFIFCQDQTFAGRVRIEGRTPGRPPSPALPSSAPLQLGSYPQLPPLPLPFAFIQVPGPHRPWPSFLLRRPAFPGAREMPSPIAALIDLNATFGALFIGFGASALSVSSLSPITSFPAPPVSNPRPGIQLTTRSSLPPRSAFGVMSMQMYSYFTRYPLDVWWYKCLVRSSLAQVPSLRSHHGR